MNPLKQYSRGATRENSFLPEDYVEQRAERRTNVISLSLFAVVMFAVFAAFLVTNRQWNTVKAQQRAINIEYTNAANDIEQLEILQEQQETMMHKAELTAALIERVPRSVLLAELINRMPDNVSMLEFTLSQEQPRRRRAPAQAQTKNLKGEKGRRATQAEAQEEEEVIEVPRFETELQLVGVAPTDVEVSDYIAGLNACDLLMNVTLKYSENSMVEDRMVREFRIHMKLDPQADARKIEPLLAQRPIEAHREAKDLLFGELPEALEEADDGAGDGGTWSNAFRKMKDMMDQQQDESEVAGVDDGPGGE
jgi:Tfp pilus assembly protein PilN